MLTLITYDIPSNKRRVKLAKLLEGFGQRVQESVFECDLNGKQLRELQKKLKRRLKPEEGDNLRIYYFCAACAQRVEVIGNGPAPIKQPEIIII
jgi:CRISPR-associated protein Cas2